MAIVTSVKDGGTWRTIRAIGVNDSGTWRNIRAKYVNDSGTWRQVFRYADVLSISVGNNGGTLDGYDSGSYGSLTPDLLADGTVVESIVENDNPGTLQIQVLTYSASQLTSGYFSSITSNGVTVLAADIDSFSSFNAGAPPGPTGKPWLSSFRWDGGVFGWTNGNSYDIEIIRA